MLIVASLQLIRNVEKLIAQEMLLKNRVAKHSHLQGAADDALVIMHAMLAKMIEQHMLIVEQSAWDQSSKRTVN